MKNKFILFSLLSIGTLGLTSCNRELQQYSSTQEEELSAMKSPDNFRAVIDGAYDSFKSNPAGVYYSGDTNSNMILGDVLSDNLIYCEDGRASNYSNYIWKITPTSGPTSLYYAAYHTISRANYALKYIDNLPVAPFRANIEAEARAIRAIAHFDLVKGYAKIPTQSADAATSLGVAYVDKYDAYATPVRIPVKDVYYKILDDLYFAKNNITQNDSNRSRLNKAAICAYIAKVLLFMGDNLSYTSSTNNPSNLGSYALSKAEALQAISLNSDPGSFTLDSAAPTSFNTNSSFKTMWTQDSATGVMFKIANSDIENVPVGNAYLQGALSTLRSEYVVPASFRAMFATNDIRRATYTYAGSYYGTPYTNVIKYYQRSNPITLSQSTRNVVDIKLMRVAEAMLTAAEAAYRSGDVATALTQLNNLRAKRYGGFTAGTESGSTLLQAILKERRLELAFENDRFFTLKRLALGLNRVDEGSNTNGVDGQHPTVLSIPASDYRWQWAIPYTAIQSNPSIQQNPGY